MEKIQIRRSGINIPDPQHCVFSLIGGGSLSGSGSGFGSDSGAEMVVKKKKYEWLYFVELDVLSGILQASFEA